MDMFFFFFFKANNNDEIASLEFVAIGVATKEIKKGEMPVVLEKFPMAPTRGSAMIPAIAAPAIK